MGQLKQVCTQLHIGRTVVQSEENYNTRSPMDRLVMQLKTNVYAYKQESGAVRTKLKYIITYIHILVDRTDVQYKQNCYCYRTVV